MEKEKNAVSENLSAKKQLHTHTHADSGHEHAHSHAHEDGGHGHAHSHAHEDGGHEHAHSHAHGDSGHEHAHPNAKAVANRLAKAAGHLESVRRMVERGEDCSQVLIQLAAVRSAINNAGKVILMDHISHCIVDAVEEGDYGKIDELNEAIRKFIK